jgi:glycosyltransferase involved in cell wall biosynthesis
LRREAARDAAAGDATAETEHDATEQAGKRADDSARIPKDEAERPMRVAFDSRPAADPYGVGRYANCLLAALRATAPDDADIAETHRPRRVDDVYHSPWLHGALLRSPCPMVVTLHDLVALKRRSEYLRTGMRLQLRYLAVQRAVRVIVPTEAVALDAAELLGLDRSRLVVVPEAPAPTMYPRGEDEVAAVRASLGLPERYLVFVGDMRHPEPRKQLARLAATPRSMPLVLVGPTRPWAHELPNVILTGVVSDENLAAIYTGAHALVLPSEDEGFGLPTVEALACGAPVVACEVPALREVLDGRATFVERGDTAELVAEAEAARRPAPAPPPWRWVDAARATWAAYEEAVSEASAGRTTAVGPCRAATPVGVRAGAEL